MSKPWPPPSAPFPIEPANSVRVIDKISRIEDVTLDEIRHSPIDLGRRAQDEPIVEAFFSS
jgi:hypothetical protein